MYALPPILLGVAALAFFAFQIVRFLGIGLLGLLIGFIAVQVDLDKEGVIGPSVLHAQQMMALQNASPSERAAPRREMQSHAGRRRKHSKGEVAVCQMTARAKNGDQQFCRRQIF